MFRQVHLTAKLPTRTHDGQPRVRPRKSRTAACSTASTRFSKPTPAKCSNAAMIPRRRSSPISMRESDRPEVYPPSTCAKVITSGGCTVEAPASSPDVMDPEEACQRAIEAGLVVHCERHRSTAKHRSRHSLAASSCRARSTRRLRARCSDPPAGTTAETDCVRAGCRGQERQLRPRAARRRAGLIVPGRPVSCGNESSSRIKSGRRVGSLAHSRGV